MPHITRHESSSSNFAEDRVGYSFSSSTTGFRSFGRQDSSNATTIPDLPRLAHPSLEPKKLILCFDGTGNTFTGSNADTNVVKILNKLDRQHPYQYHYYQTGIGTYDINEKTVNKTILGEVSSYVSQTIDSGIGMTFDAHVLAGYRFLMRYYDSGDKIYMFGFSRGAFTAKFLARMIHTVGLLCKGNEEMVPFAYRLYQRYLAGEVEDFEAAYPQKQAKKGPKTTASGGTLSESVLNDDHEDFFGHFGRHREEAHNEITAFSNTFCRKETIIHDGHLEESNIKVYFLGIWDCVNSVAVLERKSPIPVPVKGTAHYVRHAVAVDERRVKFKAALLAQDIRASNHDHEDIKEVWFPGNHGDVGGGWPANKDNPLDNSEKMTFWQRIKNVWTTRKAKGASANVANDPFQMSDIPLAWMIRELELVGQKDATAAVKWNNNVNGFKRRFNKSKDQALRGFQHDTLRFGYGCGFFSVLMWKLMEWLPFITRWELEDNEWVNVRFPLNKGNTRDIPKDAVLHESLVWRLKNDPLYHPPNNHGGHMKPCLKHDGELNEFVPMTEVTERAKEEGEAESDHKTYKFKQSVDDVTKKDGNGKRSVRDIDRFI